MMITLIHTSKYYFAMNKKTIHQNGVTPIIRYGRQFVGFFLLVFVHICLAFNEARADSQIGMNKFELLKQYLGTASSGDGSHAFRRVTRAMAEKSLDDAHDIGASFVRVAVTGTTPARFGKRGDLDVWKQSPEAHWKIVDEMMFALQARGIKIVPVFVWNLGQFPSITAEQVDALLTDPNSHSWKLLEKYISQFISRYKNYDGLLFYELGNEFNLLADLDLYTRCKKPEDMVCGAKANFTSADIIAFTKRLSELIRTLDSTRKISSGFAVPLTSAEHLRQFPEWTGNKAGWTKDTLADLERNLADMHQYVDIISVHLYPAKGNQRFGISLGEEHQLIKILKQASDKIGKPLFIGEFGDPDARNAQAGGFSDRMLDEIVNLKIPYASMWAWELYIKNTYTSYDTKHTLYSLEPGNTDYLISRFKETAAKLRSNFRKPEAPDKIPPQVVLTWPLECAKLSDKQMLYAVASDGSEAVEKVEFLVNGALLERKLKPPYQVSWNVEDQKPSEYTITARAFDRAGNQAEYSAAILVNTAKVSGGVCATAN